MEEFNTSSINLNSDDTQHVYLMDNSKNRPVVRVILLTLLAAFLGFLVLGILSDTNVDRTIVILAFAGTIVILSVLFNLLAIRSRKRTFTHFILSLTGVTFLRRNGQTIFYPITQYVNMKVTRHYYNGAYTGSSHSILFKDERGKQKEIALAGIDKDLVSLLFDDISCVKATGRFYVPEIKAAMREVPADTNIDNAIVDPGMTGGAKKLEVNPDFPFGVSPIDGKFYTHDADRVRNNAKSTNKTYILLVVTLTLFGIACLLFAAIISDPKDFFVPLAIVGGASLFSVFILGAVFLGFGLKNSETSKDLVKKIEFYSNCLVITTDYAKSVCNIPDIARVLIPKPESTSPVITRKLKIQKKDSTKLEINMGKIYSKKSFEIFGNYKQFYYDMNEWCSNHGIVCVNDISD